MAMKPEPMELEGESVESSLRQPVFPLQLVENAAVSDDRTAMQIPPEVYLAQSFNTSGQTDHRPCDFGSPPSHSAGEQILQATQYPIVTETMLGTQGQYTVAPGGLLANGALHMNSMPMSEVMLGQYVDIPQARMKRARQQREEYPMYTIARGELEVNSKFLPKKYRCGFCVYKTSYKSDLNRHLRRHTSTDCFHCDVCNMPFKTEGLVFHHKRQAHPGGKNKPMSFKCHICAYDTVYKSDYNRHLKVHATYKYACDICNKPFKVAGSVIHHKRSAHGITNCEIVVGGPMPYGATGRMVNTYRQSHSLEGNETIILDDDSNGAENAASFFQDKTSLSPNIKKTGEATCSFTDMTTVDQGSSSFSSNLGFERTAVTESSSSKQTSGTDVGETAVKGLVSLENDRESHAEDSNDQSSSVASKDCRVPCSPTEEKRKNDVSGKRAETGTIATENYLEKFADKTRPGSSLHVPAPTSELPTVGNMLNPDRSQKKQDRALKNNVGSEGQTSGDNSHEIFHKYQSRSESSSVFECPLCSFSTSHENQYIRHLERHSIKPYNCKLCNKPFQHMRNLIKHKREAHRGRQNISETVRQVEMKQLGPIRRPKRSIHLSQYTPKSNVVPPDVHRPTGTVRQMAPKSNCFPHLTSENVDSQRVSIMPLPANSSSVGTKASVTLQPCRNNGTRQTNHTTVVSPFLQEINVEHQGGVVMSRPPESGRYAKLLSDFDSFACKPYACSLCFYRTGEVDDLVVHVQNHLTGCNIEQIPESARFNFGSRQTGSPALVRPAYRQQQTSEPRHMYPVRSSSAANESLMDNQNDDQLFEEEIPGMEMSDDSEAMQSGNHCEEEEVCFEPFRLKNRGRKIGKSGRFAASARATYKRDFPRSRMYTCSICHKKFSMRLLLLRHRRKMHKIKPTEEEL